MPRRWCLSKVGAATSVLGSAALPLCLTAAKAHKGHAEPAAGSIGLAHAAFMLTNRHVTPLLHLHALNPHVTGLLETRKGAQTPLGLPRQACGAIFGPTDALGISSFAFQVGFYINCQSLGTMLAHLSMLADCAWLWLSALIHTFVSCEQGTNAHALLCGTASVDSNPLPTIAPTVWCRQRYWYTLPANALCVKASTSYRSAHASSMAL